ncbi:MAG: peptidyl-alpha-hydroxyglycine alpha-amidating lyase family protein [Gemmatimonadaceae bacterium]
MSPTATTSDDCPVARGWPQLPVGFVLGTTAGVGVSGDGVVHVFHRAGREWGDSLPRDTIGRPTIWTFDASTGRVTRRWGEGLFVMPHGLGVDREDNIWVTDVGRQQVMKFSATGNLLLTLGVRGVAGADSTHFNLPTDVAVRSDGDVYVSDGYRNSRVIQFDSRGRFVRQWGRAGSAPGEFQLPHGIALDGSGRIYVADRANGRLQVFDTTGAFITEWKGIEIGRPFAVSVAANGTVFLADGGDPGVPMPRRAGVVHLTRDGKVIRRFSRFGNYDGQLFTPHDLAAGPGDAVYVVDADGWRVQKFVCRERP